MQTVVAISLETENFEDGSTGQPLRRQLIIIKWITNSFFLWDTQNVIHYGSQTQNT